MNTPEVCTCGTEMIGRRTTSLGVFSICPHCDKPCPFDSAGLDVVCVRCVIGDTERAQ